MFGRIFYIINKIKLKIYDLFFWKLKHSKNFISINNPTIQYNIIPVINFENDDKWQFSHQNTKLISYTGEKNLTQNKLGNRYIPPSKRKNNRKENNIFVLKEDYFPKLG